MKTYTILCILLIVFQVGFSQSKTLKEANKLFANQAYAEAIQAYETEETLDSTATLKLADAYYYTADAQNASATYEKAWMLNPNQSLSTYFRYADAAKRNKDYDKANELLSTYTGEAISILETTEANDLKLPQYFMPTVLDAASAYDDFGAAYFDRQIVFASNRNAERPLYAWTGKPFLDLYYAKVSGSTITDEGLFPGAINTDTHESNAVFTADGKRMYFTRTSSQLSRIDKSKVGVLQIYSAELVGTQWSNVKPIEINNPLYSITHPALSSDGSTLYFASDMPGGFGNFDIYKAEINPDGSISNPVNLGPQINTDKLEQFPFVSESGNLYFASNRVEGLGGLDVYRSDWESGDFQEAFNLGSSINSNADDFALILKEGYGSGFFSSNRTGKDKLYALEIYPNVDYVVLGNVDDKTTLKPIPSAEVTMFNTKTGTITKTRSAEDGSFKFDVRPNSSYKFKANKELYVPTEKEVKIEYSPLTKTVIKLEMLAYADSDSLIVFNKRNQTTQINLEKIFFDFDKATIRPDAAKILNKLVEVMQKYPNMNIEVASHTDSKGSDGYNLQLSERRAQATVAYLISQGINESRLTAKGYGETDLINDCNSMNCTDAQQDVNRRSEFTILK
ncbi:OmpA family protein [Leeuwenhoekiella sp. MAR_2009_132]|uniref:OmpA family protein n=1 Tax=Leeuwenhoekiella sp. MAR_2009_132 TaxID=1392489 RepID=UPI0004911639|nr:OmpA family protein [Leeuwenhoekiella sp. MAR_2009_132]